MDILYCLLFICITGNLQHGNEPPFEELPELKPARLKIFGPDEQAAESSPKE